MDKKYIAKMCAFKQETADAVEKVRAQLASRLGFSPSFSETVAYLAADYLHRQIVTVPGNADSAESSK